jgi:aryl-alcohol dehydrogenase-like predicted oxidoreductase
MSEVSHHRWSRRAVLEGGMLAGLSAFLATRSRAADAVDPSDGSDALAKLPLITKAIPSTGERLSAIGIGTNNFSTAQYPELKQVLQRMYELGGAFVDTSSDYDDSEVVIGRALAELGIRKQIFVSTKCISENGWPRWVSSPSKIEHTYGQQSFDRSLERLQTNQVDLILAHHLRSVDALMPLLLEWKKTGKARYIGIATERWFEHKELMDKMRRYPVDFIQVDYSIGNRETADEVLPLAAERKIAVLLDIPLKFRADWGSHGDSLLSKVANVPLPPWAADIDVTNWVQFILKYSISHPAVTCATPGTTKVEHLVENQLAGRGRLPDATMRKKMEEYWDAVS